MITYKGFCLSLRSFHLTLKKVSLALVTAFDVTVSQLILQLFVGETQRPTFCAPVMNAGCTARLSNHRLAAGNWACSSTQLTTHDDQVHYI